MPAQPTVTKELQAALRRAVVEAESQRHEYVTLEHLLLAFLGDDWTRRALRACGADVKRLEKSLRESLAENQERVPGSARIEVQQTLGVTNVLQRAAEWVTSPTRTPMRDEILALPDGAALWRRFLEYDRQMTATLSRESRMCGIQILRWGEGDTVEQVSERVWTSFAWANS